MSEATPIIHGGEFRYDPGDSFTATHPTRVVGTQQSSDIVDQLRDLKMNDADDAVIDTAIEEIELLGRQIDELAEFIMGCVPGEPSRSEGAVETAIRLLRVAYATPEERYRHMLTWALALIADALRYMPTTHERTDWYEEISKWKVDARKWIETI